MDRIAYTLDEVAEALGLTRGAVDKLVRGGKLRVAKIGWRTHRVSAEAVEDCLRSSEECR